MPRPEILKLGVVKIDMPSIGTKFENFVQAGCRDLGLHCECTIALPKADHSAQPGTLFWNIFRIASMYSLPLSVIIASE